MRVSILARSNLGGTDCLRQAIELAYFAQVTDTDMKGRDIGRDVISHHRLALEIKSSVARLDISSLLARWIS